MSDNEAREAAWREWSGPPNYFNRHSMIRDGFEAGWRAAQPGEDSSTHIVWAGELMDMRERGERLADALREVLGGAPYAPIGRARRDAARAALAEWDAAVPRTPRETAPPLGRD